MGPVVRMQRERGNLWGFQWQIQVIPAPKMAYSNFVTKGTSLAIEKEIEFATWWQLYNKSIMHELAR